MYPVGSADEGVVVGVPHPNSPTTDAIVAIPIVGRRMGPRHPSVPRRLIRARLGRRDPLLNPRCARIAPRPLAPQSRHNGPGPQMRGHLPGARSGCCRLPEPAVEPLTLYVGIGGIREICSGCGTLGIGSRRGSRGRYGSEGGRCGRRCGGASRSRTTYSQGHEGNDRPPLRREPLEHSVPKKGGRVSYALADNASRWESIAAPDSRILGRARSRPLRRLSSPWLARVTTHQRPDDVHEADQARAAGGAGQPPPRAATGL